MECSGGILITIEGWGVNLVGCYGNSLLPTPSLDRIAAHGIVFDQFWMNSVELTSNIKSILEGIQPNRWLCATDSKTAAMVLRQHEDLDRLEVAQVQGVESFECLLTEAFECWLEQRQETPFLWIHSRGLSGEWDAPYEFRKLMCDAEDPVPPTETIPPDRVLPLDFDPDLLFGLACGAGAQSVCIDQGIGFLLHSLKELGIDQECWIALAGLLGFPLGEHRRIGLGKRSTSAGASNELIADAYAERLHTPWIIRPAPGMKLGVRNPCILQPYDLGAWLEQACDGIPVQGYEFRRDGAQMAWATGVEEIALITECWSARFDLVAGGNGTSCLDQSKQGEVYCFPEDRWQQNEVASRVPDVESLLRQIAFILLDPHGLEARKSDELNKLLSELSQIRR
jgi:hypothetical protein